MTLSDTTAGSDSITANDTITADYDSNSSCSSDYDTDQDSDYDSEDVSETTGPVFEEGKTFDTLGNTFEDDSSEYDTDDELGQLGINDMLLSLKSVLK